MASLSMQRFALACVALPLLAARVMAEEDPNAAPVMPRRPFRTPAVPDAGRSFMLSITDMITQASKSP